MSQVLCVGVATVDNIVLVENYPTANQRIIALDSTRAVGGPATTAAVTPVSYTHLTLPTIYSV